MEDGTAADSLPARRAPSSSLQRTRSYSRALQREVLQTTQLRDEDMLPECKTLARRSSAAGTSPRRSSSSASEGISGSLLVIVTWRSPGQDETSASTTRRCGAGYSATLPNSTGESGGS